VVLERGKKRSGNKHIAQFSGTDADNAFYGGKRLFLRMWAKKAKQGGENLKAE
jgi:hypothetical protein